MLSLFFRATLITFIKIIYKFYYLRTGGSKGETNKKKWQQ